MVGEESKGEEVSPDSKEYYDQLISNIRLFLNNHSKDTDSSQGPCQELPSMEEVLTQLCYHTINYLSMMLECETDTSVEINAMAMKYLKDEELTRWHVFVKGDRLASAAAISCVRRRPGTITVNGGEATIEGVFGERATMRSKP
nr:hypothetical protein BaRGS_030781 [Batillaria attramentaria]